MNKPLRIAAVVMAVLFACAAALAQTNKAKEAKSKPDAGVAVIPIDHLGTTKAPPMMFRDPPAQAPQPAPQQAPKK